MAEAEDPLQGGPRRLKLNRRLIRAGIVTAVALALVTFAVLHHFGFILWDEDREYYHSYFLKIDSAPDSEYVVMCPMPLDRSGNPYPGFLDELIVTSGDVDVVLAETVYGPAIEVRGTSNATIRWNASWNDDDGDWYPYLSMTIGDPFDIDLQERLAWVFLDCAGLNIAVGHFAKQTYLERSGITSGGVVAQGMTDPGSQIGWHQVHTSCIRLVPF